MPLSCFQFCNTCLDVNLTSSDKAAGGIVSIEDGVADSFVCVGNEYSDRPHSR
jgi:hypothetical protein